MNRLLTIELCHGEIKKSRMIQSITCRVGRKAQNSKILARKASKTGSIDEVMEPQSPLFRMNSVTAATMRTVDSCRTWARAVLREVSWLQSMTSADFMTSRDAMFNPVMLRLTLGSPIMEKSLNWDILNSETIRSIRKIGESKFKSTSYDGWRKKEIDDSWGLLDSKKCYVTSNLRGRLC